MGFTIVIIIIIHYIKCANHLSKYYGIKLSKRTQFGKDKREREKENRKKPNKS